MKLAIPLLLLPLLVGCRYTFVDGYRFDFRGSQAKRSESGPFPEGIEVVQLDNRFGDVEVKPASNGDAMWSWDLTVWSNSPTEAESWGEQVRLQHEVSNNTGTWTLVLPDAPARGLRGVESNLTLSVPPSVAVRIDNRGNVEVRELTGRIEVKNRHGDVLAKDTMGVTEITNEHGSITAERIGPATVNCRHGSARINQVSGDMKMRSQHADVNVVGVNGAATVEGQHGDLEVLDVAGPLRITNQHGDIRARASSAQVRLENQHGSVELDASAADVECRNQHGRIKLLLTNAELQRLQVEASHSSIHCVLPGSIAGARVDVEHGSISSDFPRVDTGDISLRTRHGDVRIERMAN